jgi:YHS domain-containing protein
MKSIITIPTLIAVFSISCTRQETTVENESSLVPYPLETCLVSGEKLGSMGEPVVIQHEGREIKFCCDSCVPKFKKEPAKYLEKLN